jgi:prokaryotic ubiquitin-like protein Pup
MADQSNSGNTSNTDPPSRQPSVAACAGPAARVAGHSCAPLCAPRRVPLGVSGTGASQVSDGGQVRRGGGSEQEPEEHVEEQGRTSTDESTKDLLDDVDELLDEIDDVLEENAEEFVRGYVQKGGQ